MSDFGGTFRGTGIALYADTSFAMAQLKALEAYGRRLKGEMAGLPAVGGPATGSPLLSPKPSGAIPGGKISTLANLSGVMQPKGITIDTGTPVTMKRSYDVIPVDIPDEPAAAAPARNRSSGGRGSRGNAASPGDAASGSAMDRHFAKMGQQFAQGPKLTNTGINLGPLTLGAGAASLKSVALKTLGPAAAYTAIVLAGVRIAEELGNQVEDAVAEAQRTRKDLGTVLVQRAKDLPGKLGASLLGVAPDLALRAYEGLTKFGVGVHAVLWGQSTGQADGNLQAAEYAFTGLRRDIGDAIAWMMGTPNSTEESKRKFQTWKAAKADAMNAATERANSDAAKVMEQVLGMGLPGTLDEIKRATFDAYNTFYRAEEAKKWIKPDLSEMAKTK